jgi:hypothetical protein
MIEWWQSAIEPHWPFLVAALVFMVIGQVMKVSVFTRPRAYAVYVDELPYEMSHLPGQPRVKRKSKWFWWWAYKTMPLHPVATGAVFGFFVQAEPDMTRGVSALYFAGAGAISVFLYQTAKGLLKRKDIELPALPGQSKSPSLRVAALPSPPKLPSIAVQRDTTGTEIPPKGSE